MLPLGKLDPGLVDAVIGTHDEIAAKLKARFAALATHLEFRLR